MTETRGVGLSVTQTPSGPLDVKIVCGEPWRPKPGRIGWTQAPDVGPTFSSIVGPPNIFKVRTCTKDSPLAVVRGCRLIGRVLKDVRVSSPKIFSYFVFISVSVKFPVPRDLEGPVPLLVVENGCRRRSTSPQRLIKRSGTR